MLPPSLPAVWGSLVHTNIHGDAKHFRQTLSFLTFCFLFPESVSPFSTCSPLSLPEFITSHSSRKIVFYGHPCPSWSIISTCSTGAWGWRSRQATEGCQAWSTGALHHSTRSVTELPPGLPEQQSTHLLLWWWLTTSLLLSTVPWIESLGYNGHPTYTLDRALYSSGFQPSII